jgi:ankyrin repeat protein
MVAAAKGHLACVDLLLAGGANVHHKDNNGFSALDCTTHCKHTAVEAALRAHIVKQEAEAAGK